MVSSCLGAVVEWGIGMVFVAGTDEFADDVAGDDAPTALVE